MRESGCHRVFATTQKLKLLLNDVKTELAKGAPEFLLEIEEIPALHDVYPHLGQENERHPFTHYPTAAVRPALRSLAMYLHSSGSTGLPKVIPQTFQSFVEWTQYSESMHTHTYYLGLLIISATGLLYLRDIDNPRVRLGSMALPPFHTMGISQQLLYPMYGICCTCIYPPVVFSPEDLPVIPTSENILEHMKKTGCDFIILVPAILHLWAQSEETIQYLKGLRAVVGRPNASA